MRATGRAAIATLVGCVLSGCSLLGDGGKFHPADARLSPQCTALESFFRASVDKEWNFSLGIIPHFVGGAGSKQVIDYQRLSEDAAKKEMALSATACEQFEAGQFGQGDAALDIYIGQMSTALDVSMRGQALAGEDVPGWLKNLDATLTTMRSAVPPEDTRTLKAVEALQKLLITKEQQLAAIENDTNEARSDIASAKDYAGKLLARAYESDRAFAAFSGADQAFRTSTASELNRLEAKLNAVATRLDQPVVRDRLVVRIPSIPVFVFFTSGSSNIEAPYLKELMFTANGVLAVAGHDEIVSATVTGYADERGSIERNTDLSTARANIVADALEALGVQIVSRHGAGATLAFGREAQANRVVTVQFSVHPAAAVKANQ